VATEPGWYSVLVKSILNRKVRTNAEEDNYSKVICKVTKKTKAPVVTGYSHCILANDTKLDDIEKFINGETVDGFEWTTLSKAENKYDAPIGSYLLMKIDTDLDELNPLLTEGLTYQWLIQTPDDNEFREITINDGGLNGILADPNRFNLNSKILVAVLNKNYSVTNFLNFACTITNTIAGDSKDIKTSEDFTFSYQ
jgi:hypothetical protein